MTIAIYDPSDNAIAQFDWTDALPDAVTVDTVVHAVESPLSITAESNTTTTSSVQISGAAHGGHYMVSASATLSNGEVINRQFPIRGWNS